MGDRYKPSKPTDKSSPEYAAYKAARKERKEARELRREEKGHKKTQSLQVQDSWYGGHASEYSDDDSDTGLSRSKPLSSRNKPKRTDSPTRGKGLYGDFGASVGVEAGFGIGSHNGRPWAPVPVPQTGKYSPVSPTSPSASPSLLPQRPPQAPVPPSGAGGYSSVPPAPTNLVPPSISGPMQYLSDNEQYVPPSASPGMYAQPLPSPSQHPQYNHQPGGFQPPTAPSSSSQSYTTAAGEIASFPPPPPTQLQFPGSSPSLNHAQVAGALPSSAGVYTQHVQQQTQSPAHIPQVPAPPVPSLFPEPLPGFGAGGCIYPPGQEPPQHNNPDYYAETAGIDIAASLNPGNPLNSAAPDDGKPSSGSGKPFGLGHLRIPSKITNGLAHLSINSSHANSNNTLAPPVSPALQPYHGTYQSISPLPSPVIGASSSPLFSASGSVVIGGHSLSGGFSLGPPAYPHHSAPQPHPAPPPPALAPPLLPNPQKKASPPPAEKHYDPSEDAEAILEALKHTFRPQPQALIDILPTLSPSQLRQLRREYKKIFQNVNVAKHIKTVYSNTSFGKLAFATALGPYESEAWFANCWYQKRETRNELLIEALMGKTNSEIKKIKEGFKDAKYDNSLEKAIRNELSSNKFRTAVLIQLEAVRMEEDTEVTIDGVREDVMRFGEILEIEDRRGGETTMIEIIVNRSDAWIREISACYKGAFGRDFAKAVMKHSKNLVGETLLHIINGAIDKPLRDAKLLDQAITAVIEQKREDLLISRMVRVHWDTGHLEHVKKAYRKKYGISLGKRLKEVIEDGTFAEFLFRMVRE